MLASLTRSQFDLACKAFCEKYACRDEDDVFATRGLCGWSWSEHNSSPGFGYLSRTVTISLKNDHEYELFDDAELVVEEKSIESVHDEAALSYRAPRNLVISRQYVVYSATFQVPAFYFSIHDTSGAPLALSDILQTSLFRPSVLEGTENTKFSLSMGASNFPLLSQGEHPTLGVPCWYFHPCETSQAVGELFDEAQQTGWTETQMLLRWLECWFMVLGTAVDLDGSLCLE